jgi:hypothetical protein
MRRVLGALVATTIAGVALAACGASGPAAPATIEGQPSLQISVPLSVAGCEGSGLCFAVGTTGLDTEPTSAAQVTADGTTWHGVAAPSAASTIIGSAGCYDHGCLFGGSNPSGDVIWRTATDTKLVAASAPAGGLGVTSISCWSAAHCAVLDSLPSGVQRVSFTSNGGLAWAAPHTLAQLGDVNGLSIDCVDAAHCVIGEAGHANSGGLAEWAATDDAFATTLYTGAGFPADTAWSQLSDLNCTISRCVARVSDGNGLSEVVVTDLSGGRWFRSPPAWAAAANLKATPNAVACTPALLCTVAGDDGDAGGLWVATGSGWLSQPLRYVSDSLTQAACSTVRCVAINGWTVVAYRP